MREYSVGVPTDLGFVIERATFARLSGLGTRRHYGRCGILYRQGDAADHVHMLLRGKVKSVLLASTGQELLLRIHLPGSLLGLLALSSMRQHDATATALEPVETSVLSRVQFLESVRADSSLAISLTQLALDRLRELHSRLRELQEHNVEQRLAMALLALRAEAVDEGLGVNLTHEELAHLVSARRQTVTAVLNRFAELRIIIKVGRRIIIANHERLARMVGLSRGPSDLH